MSNMLPKNSAPHRAKNVDVAVKHIISAVLTAKGVAADQVAALTAKRAADGLTFTQEKVADYIKRGTDAEMAYDKAFADLSAWVQSQAWT